MKHQDIEFRSTDRQLGALSQRALLLPQSGIREFMRLASQIPDSIRMEVGQPDLPTPEHVVHAAYQAALAGQTTYTPNAGTDPLRRAVGQRYGRLFDLDIGSQNVLVTPGAMTAVTLALFATLDTGDEILVPDPGFPNYAAAVQLVGAKAVPYRIDFGPDGCSVDLAQLESLISSRTRALLINFPGNPTGQVFTGAQLSALVAFAREYNLYLISDEIYDELVFDARPQSALQHDTDGRVIAIGGVSKTYSMTGWRIGWIAASEAVVAHASRFTEALYSCPSSVSQAAALAALTGPQDCVREMLSVYRQRAERAQARLAPAGVLIAPPRGAFYALVDITRSGMSSDAFCRDLLSSKKVAVAPGSTFGRISSNWVRLSFVNDGDQLVEGVDRLLAFLAELGATKPLVAASAP